MTLYKEMKTEQFWDIIDAVNLASGGDMNRKCELLKARLLELEPQEVIEFSHHFDAAESKAYSWTLWGAAYVMNGGCSDDAFMDFRATLISLGRTTYEQALADPESLAEIDFADEEDITYEGYQYVVIAVAEQRGIELTHLKDNSSDEPSGEEWDEGILEGLYPKLSAKYSIDDNHVTPISNKPWWKLW